MGYNTRYTITRVDGDASLFRRAFEMRYSARPDEAEHWFGIQIASNATKWYEHEGQISDAMSVSGITAVDLHGEGEDQGDVWDKEFRRVDGKTTIKTFRYRLVREEQSE